ncbi:hypothetical protein F1737_02025 [Methanoplanus sp. FWC-SCC4]|uniref:Uncharacterized protein n=1 Tax=Methanochimaera problematica TaxID=2609417 RepID=A0AA97F9X6_9EURY|nr:hypothetical protein [Methanoplanus sp. FWC-SCC4]WOF15545.1 hypothetical protein F1737_02025 [Methanoplanus sp. FWC-SCC4]
MTGKIQTILLILLLGVVITSVQAAATTETTIEISQNTAEIGDIIAISGKVGGQSAPAVYLFMTGPDLPDKGTPLVGDVRNAKIPYHKIYLSGPGWDYNWDTGLIVGGLKDGTYTIYSSLNPGNLDGLREGEYSETKIKIIDVKEQKMQQSPLPIWLLIFAAVFSVFVINKCKKNYKF